MDNAFILTPYFIDDYSLGLVPLARPGWQVIERWLPPGDRQQRMTELYQPLKDRVAGAVDRGLRPVSIAGDCCTSLAVTAGLQQAGLTPTLIWLDAHGDFNTWETTPSGFLGGMPLAMLVGRGEQTIADGVGLKVLNEASVILSDGRDLDPGERDALKQSAVTHIEDFAGMLDVVLPDGPLYVHFDADVLNPDEAPAMSYLAPGGPLVATVRRVFQRLAKTDQVIAVSVSCWNPEMDEDGRSRQAVLDLVATLISQEV